MSQANGNARYAGPRLGGPQRLLIVGRPQIAECLLRELERDGRSRYAVVGVIDGGDGSASLDRAAVEQLDTLLRETRPHRVLLGFDVNDQRLPLHPLVDAMSRGVIVEDIREAYERLTGRVLLENLRPSDVLCGRRRNRSARYARLPRLLSAASSLGALIILAPLLALIALAIKLDSRGPICFAQERLGAGGRRFKLLKFRTMHPSPEHRSEWVLDNLDRITRIGRWLRRFRFDELPQLINVLRGDMNLIGPRPHPATNAALFYAAIPYYPLRLIVRPGVTGWAQVRYGYANNLEEETEKMRYDLYYIKHRSLRLDLRILLGTLRVIALSRETVPTEDPATAPQPPSGDLKAA
jgi:lipopolysaccharide/colanic/teichoic acid biosynthesis glycosyltransferase